MQKKFTHEEKPLVGTFHSLNQPSSMPYHVRAAWLTTLSAKHFLSLSQSFLCYVISLLSDSTLLWQLVNMQQQVLTGQKKKEKLCTALLRTANHHIWIVPNVMGNCGSGPTCCCACPFHAYLSHHGKDRSENIPCKAAGMADSAGREAQC